jgi:hypothetical protein
VPARLDYPLYYYARRLCRERRNRDSKVLAVVLWDFRFYLLAAELPRASSVMPVRGMNLCMNIVSTVIGETILRYLISLVINIKKITGLSG